MYFPGPVGTLSSTQSNRKECQVDIKEIHEDDIEKLLVKITVD